MLWIVATQQCHPPHEPMGLLFTAQSHKTMAVTMTIPAIIVTGSAIFLVAGKDMKLFSSVAPEAP